MSTFDPNSPPPYQPNPYTPPPVAANAPSFQPSRIDPRLQRTIRDFRSQMLALGTTWIIFAVLALLFAALMLAGVVQQGTDASIMAILAAFMIIMGVLWAGIGILTCRKEMWAVYMGLVLSYIALAGNLLTLNFCGVLLVMAIIVQAHRVIGFANQIQRAGLALDAKV